MVEREHIKTQRTSMFYRGSELNRKTNQNQKMMIGEDSNNQTINLSIDTLDGMLKAKSKAKIVIDSCKTDKQLDSAKRFVNCYMNATEDMVGTSELQLMILEKRSQVSGKRFTKKSWDSLINKLKDGEEVV